MIIEKKNDFQYFFRYFRFLEKQMFMIFLINIDLELCILTLYFMNLFFILFSFNHEKYCSYLLA